ncbi:Rho GTPase-activating protein 10 [Chelonia mydas]|uniref:Rho GTPase-activating protein 10 n=1 Tax=Chelonia mydas TaxID=8469 RepID=M7C5A0_CHEMY|nr:Rho GTPase-activating protein 10 [Chelonia mydas]
MALGSSPQRKRQSLDSRTSDIRTPELRTDLSATHMGVVLWGGSGHCSLKQRVTNISELQTNSIQAAAADLSAAQRKFAHSLRDFKFEFIGDAETDDERCIDASLHEFSNFLKNLEEQREILALSVTETLIKPLEKFRKEQLGAVKEEKKKFDKETEKNYSFLEKHLNLSARKKEPQLLEADYQVEQNRKHFYELSLEYVCKLQEIQERKKFECVEPVLSFFQGIFTFYHQGYELAKDFNHYKMALQINIQNTRNRFEGTRSEVEELMNKIRRSPQEHKRANQFTMEGYLYVQEKRNEIQKFLVLFLAVYLAHASELKVLSRAVTVEHSGIAPRGQYRRIASTLPQIRPHDVDFSANPLIGEEYRNRF